MLIYLGDGKLLTWVGLGLFLITLRGFTFYSLRRGSVLVPAIAIGRAEQVTVTNGQNGCPGGHG